ncbi:MAG: acyl-CoA thioesterase, partial [Terriglobales bacterium]
FQHVNNVNYFSFFDTAVTYSELTEHVTDLYAGPMMCLVVEVQCRYHRSIAFPDRIAVGLRVVRIGGSSVRYEIGIFRNEEDEASAEGYFVHVFVARATQRPVPIPDASRAILNRISPSSRIGGVFGAALVSDQRVSWKGLHYTGWLGSGPVAIRGGGCGGRSSLSCRIRSRSSGSGWV